MNAVLYTFTFCNMTSQEDEDANLPRIVPSLFMSPGGDKFYTLLFYFTSFVMVKTCKNDHGEFAAFGQAVFLCILSYDLQCN